MSLEYMPSELIAGISVKSKPSSSPIIRSRFEISAKSVVIRISMGGYVGVVAVALPTK
jgi:hypothetical protein